jgi:hypothetical protein
MSAVTPPSLAGRGEQAATLSRRVAVSTVCAGSAGVHAALVPHHLDESVVLGVAFIGSAIALALAAVATRDPRRDPWGPALAATVLAMTALAYLLSRTVGLPLLIDTPEAVDPLGVTTSAVEVLGALACLPFLDRKD